MLDGIMTRLRLVLLDIDIVEAGPRFDLTVT